MPRFDWSDDGYFVTESRDLRQIRRVLILTMLLNFSAMGIKIVAGVLTGALSLFADGLDSLLDGLSNAIGLAGLYIAGKPPDAEHPYGHRKFETIAALSISFLIFLVCWQLLQAAWGRLSQEASPQIGSWTIAAMLVAMVIQALTSYYELRAGKRLQSEVLKADALHTRASILVSLSVLVGLILVGLGYPQADPIATVLVAIFIAKIGVDILRETIPVLVDQATIDPRQIGEIVHAVGGVESFHRVRSRGAEGSAAVDLHVRVSPNKTVQEADAIASEVRRRLLALESVTDVTVHVEAQRQTQPAAGDLFAILKHAASELGLVIHESWAYRLDGNLYLEMHVGVDPLLTLGEAHDLVDRLEQAMHLRVPEIEEVHTHIEVANVRVQEGERVNPKLEDIIWGEIQRILLNIPSLSDPHNLIVRSSEADGASYYVSLECTIAPETSVTEAHRFSTKLEDELSRRLDSVVDVFVHLEPPESA
jgi:cation diffusion facilitator family transporter